MRRKPIEKIRSALRYFTTGKLILWCSSMVLILTSFLLFDRGNDLTPAASSIGATSLLFNAKGNPLGQFLTIVFSVLYGVTSFQMAYYGEILFRHHLLRHFPGQ